MLSSLIFGAAALISSLIWPVSLARTQEFHASLHLQPTSTVAVIFLQVSLTDVSSTSDERIAVQQPTLIKHLDPSTQRNSGLWAGLQLGNGFLDRCIARLESFVCTSERLRAYFAYSKVQRCQNLKRSFLEFEIIGLEHIWNNSIRVWSWYWGVRILKHMVTSNITRRDVPSVDFVSESSIAFEEILTLP